MTAPRPDALLRTKPTPKPVIRCLATVEPETVNFLWPSRIAFGKLSLIVGDPGLGKSTVMLDVAARMSRGAEWPDGGSTPRAPIVLLSAEDGLGDTIRPRLDALGADVNMVHALTAVQLPTGNERCVSLATDIEAVETTIEQTGARLVVIDPLSAYMGRLTDSYKDGDVRSVLMPLVALGERRRVAIVGIMHLGKSEKRSAIYRALGSVAFVAAARMVFAVAPHPDEDGKRVIAWVKGNLSRPAETLAYQFANDLLVWDRTPVLGLDVDGLLSGPVDREERREAAAWLRDRLAEGPVLSKPLMAEAEQAGISRRTLFRAKAHLHIQAKLEGYGAKGKWSWHLPMPDEPLAIDRSVALSEEIDKNAQSFTENASGTLLDPWHSLEQTEQVETVQDFSRQWDAADERFHKGWKE